MKPAKTSTRERGVNEITQIAFQAGEQVRQMQQQQEKQKQLATVPLMPQPVQQQQAQHRHSRQQVAQLTPQRNLSRREVAPNGALKVVPQPVIEDVDVCTDVVGAMFCKNANGFTFTRG